MITTKETKSFLSEVHHFYGYNMTNYDLSFSRKALMKMMGLHQKKSFSVFREYILHDEMLIKEMCGHFFINVSWMFRDPDVWRAIKKKILPYLDSYPLIRIWSAGCATGEEAYALSILIHELGLSDRTIIYATDIDTSALAIAKNGRYKIPHIFTCMENYYLSGGSEKFTQYFSVDKDEVVMDPSLRDIICFAEHNLITDASFNTFGLILCRNLFIYFDEDLQSHALTKFMHSLENGGFFISGKQEYLEKIGIKQYFETHDLKNKIYKKVK